MMNDILLSAISHSYCNKRNTWSTISCASIFLRFRTKLSRCSRWFVIFSHHKSPMILNRFALFPFKSAFVEHSNIHRTLLANLLISLDNVTVPRGTAVSTDVSPRNELIPNEFMWETFSVQRLLQIQFCNVFHFAK